MNQIELNFQKEIMFSKSAGSDQGPGVQKEDSELRMAPYVTVSDLFHDILINFKSPFHYRTQRV